MTYRDPNTLRGLDRLNAIMRAAQRKGTGKPVSLYIPALLSDRMKGVELRAAAAGTPLKRSYWADVARAAFTMVCEADEAAGTAKQSAGADDIA